MLKKIKTFLINYPISSVSLILYYVWWYVLYLFGNKGYDNSAAGGMAIVGLAGLTLIFFLLILAGFIISMIQKKEKRVIYLTLIFLLNIPFLLLPLFK